MSAHLGSSCSTSSHDLMAKLVSIVKTWVDSTVPVHKRPVVLVPISSTIAEWFVVWLQKFLECEVASTVYMWSWNSEVPMAL